LRPSIILAVVAALWALPWPGPTPAAGQFAGWWKSQWRFRRIVTVEGAPTKLPGDDAAVVQFPTHGALAPDGRDVRVLIANRQEVPHRVLFVGPGDLCRVVFAVQPGAQQYTIYYGNPDAPAPAGEAFSPRRGLLLETRKWRGGALFGLQRVQAAMRTRARPVQGRDFVAEIFWGVNLFASTGNECNHFDGWLLCREAGVYEFATTSDDASFLTIDGRLVVQWPGRHGPRHDSKHSGKVQLTRGLHRIEYFHVNVGERGMAVAAWKPPSGRWPRKIPAEAFAPVFRGRLGRLDEYQKRRTADFLWRHDGEAFFNNRYVQRLAFRAAVPKNIRPSYVQWDFGDGLKATGAQVSHVFLTDGPRKVTLTLQWLGATYRCTNTIQVQRDWRRQADRRLLGLRGIFEQIKEYDWPAMRGEDLRVAIELFQKLGRTDELLNVCAAVIDKPDADPTARTEAALLAADLYVDRRNEADAAVAMLAAVAEKTTDAAARARLDVKRAAILLHEIGHKAATDTAEKLLTQVNQTQQIDRTLRRRALAGLGDVWRRRGDGPKARGFYQKAADIAVFQRNHTQNIVRIGALARYVEEYVRTGAWRDARRFLGEWEWEYPLERLNGYSTLLRVEMAEKRGHPDKAAALATELVRANPKSPYADQLLLRAADDYRQTKDPKRALETARQLLRDYPESPLVPDAQKRIKQWAPTPPRPAP
jgi:tetratricopeptide (TPR) repeat protein